MNRGLRPSDLLWKISTPLEINKFIIDKSYLNRKEVMSSDSPFALTLFRFAPADINSSTIEFLFNSSTAYSIGNKASYRS